RWTRGCSRRGRTRPRGRSYDGLPGVVDLPGDLPALGLAARDGLLELFHHLLEGVTVAVVQDRHPRRGDRLGDDVLGLGLRDDLFDHTAAPWTSLPLDLLEEFPRDEELHDLVRARAD